MKGRERGTAEAACLRNALDMVVTEEEGGPCDS